MPYLYYCGNQWGYTPLGTTANVPTGFCNPPTGLLTTVQGQYVTFSWVAPHDYTKFVLEYRIGVDAYTVVDVFGTSIKIALAGNTTYNWRVKTFCQIGNQSTYANGVDVTTQAAFASCTPVASVTVTNMGDFYRLSWASTGAQYYKVYWAAQNSPRPTLFEATTQTNQYDLPDLTPGITYKAQVVSYCQDPNLPPGPSPWVTFDTGLLNCPQPGPINFTIGATTILIGWVGSPGKLYNIYLDGALVAVNYPQTSFSFSGLNPNTTYTIEVRTNCESGFSQPRTIQITTALANCVAPTNLIVSNIIATGFQVDWTPAAGGNPQRIILNNGAPIALLAGVSTYLFSGLPSGSFNNVQVQTVCSGNGSASLSTNVQLTGCAAPTGLVTTPSNTSSLIKWDIVANAVEYFVQVRKNSDNSLVFSIIVNINETTAFGLIASTLYDISIIARCGVPGSTLIDSTALTGQVTTIATPACENGTILTQAISQNGYDFTFDFASGITTGIFKIIVRKDSDNSLVYETTVNSLVPISVTGLLPATLYKLFIYREANTGGVTCTPTQLSSFTTTGLCGPVTNIVLTLQTNETELQVDATPPGVAPTNYQIFYKKANDAAFVDKGAHALPYVITGITPGKHQVQVRSNCVGSVSALVTSAFICSTPKIQNAAVSQNTVTILWDAMEGVDLYKIEIQSLAGGIATYTSNTNSITIPDLPWNTNFIGTVQIECNTGSFTSSLPFTFATGNQTQGTDPSLCQPPEFTAYIQDCSVTDPGDDDHDDDDDPTPPGGCTITERDWTKIAAIFMDVVSGPNNAFMELTLQYSQNYAIGEVALMPGGVMAVVSTNCRPISTLTMPYTIIQGGSVITGDVTVATNGNVTISGSYTSDGGPLLIIRAAGNYIK